MTYYRLKQQEGAALLVALISLFLVSILGVIGLRSAAVDLAATANSRQAAQAYQAASGAVSQYVLNLDPNNSALLTVVNDAANPPLLFNETVGDFNTVVEVGLGSYGLCPCEAGSACDARDTCFFFDATSVATNNSQATATVGIGFYGYGVSN